MNVKQTILGRETVWKNLSLCVCLCVGGETARWFVIGTESETKESFTEIDQLSLERTLSLSELATTAYDLLSSSLSLSLSLSLFPS